MFLTAYTIVHTLISLVGIVSGFVVLFGLLTAKRFDGWTSVFLATTVATSVTGFGFPSITSCLARRRADRWSSSLSPSSRGTPSSRRGVAAIYVITAVMALYFSVVLIVQAFRRVAAAERLAPTQTGRHSGSRGSRRWCSSRPWGLSR
jgi:hypothetical protein